MRSRVAGWRSWLTLALATVSLLGQGERCHIDLMLRTPGSALAAYWEALQLNDVDGVRSCSLEQDPSLPFPGMLWAFPNTRAVWLKDLGYVPVDENCVVVAYEVHFKPIGSDLERSLRVMTELVRRRGEWRVTRPLAESGLMTGRPLPTRVDI